MCFRFISGILNPRLRLAAAELLFLPDLQEEHLGTPNVQAGTR